MKIGSRKVGRITVNPRVGALVSALSALQPYTWVRQRANRPLQVRVAGQLYKSPGVRRHRADEHRDITFEIEPEVSEEIAAALRQGDEERAEELFEEALADDYYDLTVGDVEELEGEWEE